MTPFVDAARAEARKRVTNRLAGRFSVAELIGWFVAGAVWARDRLAEQEPSDAEVEAVAVAICAGEGAGDLYSWGPSTQERFRETARAALREAARIRKEQER